MSIHDPYQNAVKRGANYLDMIRPGWYDRINVAELDMTNAKGCILGQLDGDYWQSVRDAGWQNSALPVTFGFTLPTGTHDFLPWHLLGAAWKAEIHIRRNERTAFTGPAPHIPRRGDDVERWLKAHRDVYLDPGSDQPNLEDSYPWNTINDLLDNYRLHADTGANLADTVQETRT